MINSILSIGNVCLMQTHNRNANVCSLVLLVFLSFLNFLRFELISFFQVESLGSLAQNSAFLTNRKQFNQSTAFQTVSDRFWLQSVIENVPIWERLDRGRERENRRPIEKEGLTNIKEDLKHLTAKFLLPMLDLTYIYILSVCLPRVSLSIEPPNECANRVFVHSLFFYISLPLPKLFLFWPVYMFSFFDARSLWAPNDGIE